MNKTKNMPVYFDSVKYSRKINVISHLVVNNETQPQILLECDRFVIRNSDEYHRLDIVLSDSAMVNVFEKEILDKFYEERKTATSVYITFIAKPEGVDVPVSVVCFSVFAPTYFDEGSVSDGKRLYSAVIQSDFFVKMNNETIRDKVYDDFVVKENEVSDEETKLIKEILKEQDSPEYFLSLKEYKEIKKKLDKEKKQKEGGGFFSPKKKETNQKENLKTESGEFINPKSLKIHKGSTSPDYELEKIIGLENVKKDIQKMRYMIDYEKNRSERGIQRNEDASLHMCYMGNPGTGKTTIARIMTGILFEMKNIKENKCIEISGLDLKGGYIGQTAIITKQIVDMARNGILFVDEAYALCEDSTNSYGKEAVSVLLKEMEDNRGDLIVILAGYEDDMNKFLNVNPGFRSRINKYFDFVDYTTTELTKIFVNYLKKMHLKIDEEALKKCVKLFNSARTKPNFSNGRFVRNLAEQIEEQHILNCVGAPDERVDIVTIDDVTDEIIDKMLYGI